MRAPGPVARGLKIGLLGGSFDPAHDGHRYASLVALKALKLDYVWWLVSPGNPLKSTATPLRQRLADARDMARHPRIRVTGIEARLGTRYTVDTVTALQRQFPHVGFVWLVGSDNLAQFGRWKNWQRLAAIIPIAVVRRPGSILASLNAAPVRHFGLSRRLGPPPCLLVVDGRRSLLSSTALRVPILPLEPRA